MKVAITGSTGQLGAALVSLLGPNAAVPLDRAILDITVLPTVMNVIGGLNIDLVIHCAAMTNVDGCARDPEEAYRVNALGTRNVTLACARIGVPMVYISTNEVFDGAATTPYHEWMQPNPINPYGSSKAAGEWFVSHLLKRFYIVRTSWLFGSHGHNFPHRIIELALKYGTLRIVTDEVSNPTAIPDLAMALVALIETEAYGIYHLTNAGNCSRYAFARAVLSNKGMTDIRVLPIRQADYQRASTPPPFTPLVNWAAASLGIELRPWQDALTDLFSP